MNSLATVLLQEIDRFNKLLSVIKARLCIVFIMTLKIVEHPINNAKSVTFYLHEYIYTFIHRICMHTYIMIFTYKHNKGVMYLEIYVVPLSIVYKLLCTQMSESSTRLICINFCYNCERKAFHSLQTSLKKLQFSIKRFDVISKNCC